MAKVGRPRKYQTPVALQTAVDRYFTECNNSWSEKGEKPPTIAGLALALGFTQTKQLYDIDTRVKALQRKYEEAVLSEDREAIGKKLETEKAFKAVIDNARARIEAWNLEHLYNNNTYRGAAWALERGFGYTHESTVKVGNAEDKPLQVKMTIDEKLDLIEKIKNGDI